MEVIQEQGRWYIKQHGFYLTVTGWDETPAYALSFRDYASAEAQCRLETALAELVKEIA